MASYSKDRVRNGPNTARSLTCTERTYEILRRLSFARDCPIKAILEEIVEPLADEASAMTREKLPALTYFHEPVK